jgi:hypothetical protein
VVCRTDPPRERTTLAVIAVPGSAPGISVVDVYDKIGNQGVRRRQLHDILRHPGYDSMLAARGEPLPEDP